MCHLQGLCVWILSLGCPKNRVDTEHLLGSLGRPVIPTDKLGKCQLALINTCAFIEPATRESIRAILDVAQKLKKLKRKPLLAVAGCMVGRYGQAELAKELPEVDLWLPTKELESWPAMLSRALGLESEARAGRLLSTGPAYAWLKIGEGCRHACTFCAIPAIRGPLKSQKASSILAEAEDLLAKGVKELDLVAQDVTSWGKDFTGSQKGNIRNLPQLLEKLASLPALQWLRLLYLYPASLDDDLLAAMRDIGRPILPYLDIPLQHCQPEILGKMGRPFNVSALKLLERIRNYLPDAAIRATLIVGFPGETERDFQELLKFVAEASFQHLGVFAYQAEEGTKAALLPNRPDEKAGAERRRELMALQSEISAEYLETFVGREMDVLVDRPQGEWPGLHVGRVWFQAPEVDGLTYVSGPGVRPGAMLKCEICGSHTYDLDALAPPS